MAAREQPATYARTGRWISTGRAGARREEKRIARLKTASLVEDGQTVILDGGSTVAAVARRCGSSCMCHEFAADRGNARRRGAD